MPKYAILETIETTEAKRAALAFSFLLAAEKGVRNEVRRHARGHAVVADDNRAILFAQVGEAR